MLNIHLRSALLAGVIAFVLYLLFTLLANGAAITDSWGRGLVVGAAVFVTVYVITHIIRHMAGNPEGADVQSED